MLKTGISFLRYIVSVNGLKMVPGGGGGGGGGGGAVQFGHVLYIVEQSISGHVGQGFGIGHIGGTGHIGLLQFLFLLIYKYTTRHTNIIMIVATIPIPK
jgi:hypothetical protein